MDPTPNKPQLTIAKKKTVLGSKRPMQCNKEGGMQKISDFLFLIFL
jgi:hypothetical protein